jgi:hypothetical protein
MVKTGTRWILVGGRGSYVGPGNNGRGLWGMNVRPMYGSEDTMQEIRRELRKHGVRCKLVRVPDGWTNPDPIL